MRNLKWISIILLGHLDLYIFHICTYMYINIFRIIFQTRISYKYRNLCITLCNITNFPNATDAVIVTSYCTLLLQPPPPPPPPPTFLPYEKQPREIVEKNRRRRKYDRGWENKKRLLDLERFRRRKRISTDSARILLLLLNNEILLPRPCCVTLLFSRLLITGNTSWFSKLFDKLIFNIRVAYFQNPLDPFFRKIELAMLSFT